MGWCNMSFLPKNQNKINLEELHNDGQDFAFTLEDSGLAESLKDLDIKSLECNFNLMPAGDLYTLTGQIKFEPNLICSKCAFGFSKPITESMNELFYIKTDDLQKSDKRKKSDSITGNDIFCNELNSKYLIVSEWIREIVVSATPYSSTGKENCDDTCDNYQKAVKEGLFTPESEAKAANNPFAALEGLKNKLN